MWQTGSRGIPVSRSGYYVSFSVTGGKAETSDGKRQLIRGGGSIARISNDYGPQDVAREYDVPRGWTSPLFAEARVPPVGTVVQYVRPDCSDFCVPDDIPELLEPVRDMDDSFPVAGDVVRPGMSPVVPDSWPRFAEARVPPVGTPVHCVDSDCSDFCGADGDPELLGSIRDTVNSLSAGADVFVPGMSLIVLAGTAAVPLCLLAVTGQCSWSFLLGRSLL